MAHQAGGRKYLIRLGNTFMTVGAIAVAAMYAPVIGTKFSKLMTVQAARRTDLLVCPAPEWKRNGNGCCQHTNICTNALFPHLTTSFGLNVTPVAREPLAQHFSKTAFPVKGKTLHPLLFIISEIDLEGNFLPVLD